MSLGFKINNEWLDLKPGTVLELERENPFLQFGDEVVGEYSMPVDVPNTAKNIRLLKYAGLVQQKVDVEGVAAQCFDTGLQHSVGRLKVERPSHHLNNNASGSTSLYYLTGSADFNQQTKSLKIRDANYGGDRVFQRNTTYATRPAGTLLAHVYDVMMAPSGAYDYAFFPTVCEDTGSLSPTGTVSKVINGFVQHFGIGSGDSISFNTFVPVVPYPYLKYVLERAITYAGWRIEGAALNDADFKKAAILNHAVLNNQFLTGIPTVTINLRNHLPDWTIPELLGHIRRRFGWWYDYDTKAKVVRIKTLKEVIGTSFKEMTAYADPVIGKKVATQKTVYGLKHTDNSKAALKWDNVHLQSPVFLKSALPAAGVGRYLHVHLVIAENNFYICRADDNGVWGWNLYSYNTMNVEPAGMSAEVTTAVNTTGNEYFSNLYDFIPRLDGSVSFVDEGLGGSNVMPLVFYHGLQVNKSGQQLPYASAHPYSSTGVKLTSWSLAFECKLQDGSDVGLYHLQWKPILDTFTSNEDLEVKLNLPKAAFLQLKFSDVITIANVRMYMRKILSTVSYDGKVRLECVRI